MRYTILVLCTVASLFALSGCSFIRVNVSAFQELTPQDRTARIGVAAWREQMKDSLEFRTYAARVETHLRTKGFNVVPLKERPELIAFLDFGIDDGREVAESYVVPQYGVTGYSSSFTTGTITSYGGGYGTYSGMTTYTPRYGVTGYTTGVKTRTEFNRYVYIDVVRVSQTEHKKVYEGKLRSRGSCGNLPTIMPPLLDVLFKDFPAGGSRTLDVPWDGQC